MDILLGGAVALVSAVVIWMLEGRRSEGRLRAQHAREGQLARDRRLREMWLDQIDDTQAFVGGSLEAIRFIAEGREAVVPRPIDYPNQDVRLIADPEVLEAVSRVLSQSILGRSDIELSRAAGTAEGNVYRILMAQRELVARGEDPSRLTQDEARLVDFSLRSFAKPRQDRELREPDLGVGGASDED
jgi:hypothetical protein